MPLRPKHKQPPEDSGKSTLESLSRAYRQLGPYLNLGYFFVIAIGGLTYLGSYLDRTWGTQPWLTVAGAVLGITTSFYYLFRIVLKSEKEDQNQ